jgi:hypothetical protein
MAQSKLSKTTHDHDEIRRWAEARKAIPCEVASTEHEGEAGILRFCFPNAKNRNDDALKEIDWEQFFAKFDENGLSLVYQEKTAGGARSNFNKLIHADSEAGTRSNSGSSSSRSSSTASRSRSAGKSGSASHGHTTGRHHAA